MRYLLWQFGHMHTLRFEHNDKREIFCPRCGAIYQNRKTLSTPSPSPKSSLTIFTLILLSVSLIVGAAAYIAVSVPLGLFAVVLGLAAVVGAVLSLRELL